MMRAGEAIGRGPMALVAVEQRFPPGQRILADELVGRMMPFGGRALLAATAVPGAGDGLMRPVDKAFPGLWAGVMWPQAPHRRGLVHGRGSVRRAAQSGRRLGHARLSAARAGAYPRLGGRSASNDRRQAGAPARAVRPNACPRHPSRLRSRPRRPCNGFGRARL
jgi:hypothetical protein